MELLHMHFKTWVLVKYDVKMMHLRVACIADNKQARNKQTCIIQKILEGPGYLHKHFFYFSSFHPSFQFVAHLTMMSNQKRGTIADDSINIGFDPADEVLMKAFDTMMDLLWLGVLQRRKVVLNSSGNKLWNNSVFVA